MVSESAVEHGAGAVAIGGVLVLVLAFFAYAILMTEATVAALGLAFAVIGGSALLGSLGYVGLRTLGFR